MYTWLLGNQILQALHQGMQHNVLTIEQVDRGYAINRRGVQTMYNYTLTTPLTRQ